MRKHNSRSPYNAHTMGANATGMPNKPIWGWGFGFSKKYDTGHDHGAGAFYHSGVNKQSANDRRRIFYNTKAPMKDADSCNNLDSISPSWEASPIRSNKK